jgi:hypothetical protein
MRYLVLASDYDGTLARDGKVDPATLAALIRLKQSGRSLVLVTGRELSDLLRVFPEVELCDRVVAENGAVLYCPAERRTHALAKSPAPELVEALRARGVNPLSVGEAIVATWHPNESIVIEVIRELGLELQVTFNKGAVMVLPSGVNKASGLKAALDELSISPHNVVGVGDAENDHAFLELCECAVAVANALPSLQQAADWVTPEPRGQGVAALIELLLSSDASEVLACSERHRIVLGAAEDGTPVSVLPYSGSVLVAGASGGGKSTLTTTFLERLMEPGYQFCLIDPEGDYEGFDGASMIGGIDHPPATTEVIGLLARPDQNVIVNLLGVPLHDRPAAGLALLTALFEMRAQRGHPHWIVCDEAHHLLPAEMQSLQLALPERLQNTLLVTTDPAKLLEPVIQAIEVVFAVGSEPVQTLRSFYEKRGDSPPVLGDECELEHGQALVSSPGDRLVKRAKLDLPEHALRRHRRKYAKGELGPDKSFYFRGPEDKLNLRAQNLVLFLQIAEGVDDATWLHHLRQADYSRWFAEAVKDRALAEQAARIESDPKISADESRARIRALVQERYTLPA